MLFVAAGRHRHKRPSTMVGVVCHSLLFSSLLFSYPLLSFTPLTKCLPLASPSPSLPLSLSLVSLSFFQVLSSKSEINFPTEESSLVVSKPRFVLIVVTSVIAPSSTRDQIVCRSEPERCLSTTTYIVCSFHSVLFSASGPRATNEKEEEQGLKLELHE